MNNILMILYAITMDTEAIVTVLGIVFLPALVYGIFHFIAVEAQDQEEEPSDFL